MVETSSICPSQLFVVWVNDVPTATIQPYENNFCINIHFLQQMKMTGGANESVFEVI